MLLRIQGLRGIAILAVLLFHFWPKTFPNGYVGVDIFFVISGYLMAMIFRRQRVLNFRTVLDFYYRRIKRIFPLYYLVLPCTLLSGHLFLGKAWIASTNELALYSLALSKNMKTIWDGQNYFLAVRLCLLSKNSSSVPNLLRTEGHFPPPLVSCRGGSVLPLGPIHISCTELFKKELLEIVFLVVFSAASCAHYYYSAPVFSFNFCLDRMWQFVAGMIGFFSSHMKEMGLETKKAPSKTLLMTEKLEDAAVCIAYIPLLFMLAPQTVASTVMRPLATASCFLLIVLENQFSKNVLTGGLITYIGDLSYALYLVHWPVIVLFSQSYTVQFTLGLIFILTIAMQHYETWYRKFGVKKILVFIGTLALFNTLVFTSLFTCPFIKRGLEKLKEGNVTVDRQQAIEKNIEFAKIFVGDIVKVPRNDTASARVPTLTKYWGVYDFPRGNGTEKVMVIGNSYALNEGNIIQEEFRGNYSEFRLLGALGFQVLYDEWFLPTQELHGQHDKLFPMIEEFQPDYLFIATRYQIHQKRMLRGDDMTQDILVQQYNKNLVRLEQFTKKKIFIHGPTPNFPFVQLNHLIDALGTGGDLEKFHLNKTDADDEMYSGLKRVEGVTCQKCELYSILPAFQDGDRYLGFDPNTFLSFVDNDMHLTLPLQERLRPIYRSIIEKLY